LARSWCEEYGPLESRLTAPTLFRDSDEADRDEREEERQRDVVRAQRSARGAVEGAQPLRERGRNRRPRRLPRRIERDRGDMNAWPTSGPRARRRINVERAAKSLDGWLLREKDAEAAPFK